MVDCIKSCNSCSECENLIYNEPITFIKTYGLTEKRETLVGYKCLLYGQYSETVDGLRDSELFDEIIFIR